MSLYVGALVRLAIIQLRRLQQRSLSVSNALVRSPASDVDDLVAACDNARRSLLHVHASYRVVHQSARPSQHWFDAECPVTKRKTRALERAYRAVVSR